MREFTVCKSVESLIFFTNLVCSSVSKADDKSQAKKKGDKIVDVEPPTTTHRNVKITYADGRSDYVPPSEYGQDAQASQTMKPSAVKRSPKPEILSDIQNIHADVISEKLSLDQASTEANKIAKRVGTKLMELRDRISDSEKKDLFEAAKKAKEFRKLAEEAVHGDSREKLAGAVEMLQGVVEGVDKLDRSIKKRESSDKDGSKPEEGDKPATSSDDSGEVDPREFLYEKAELSTAPWEGKIKDIEAAITGKIVERKTSGAGTANGVFFEKSEAGYRGVFKPDSLSVGVGEMRDEDIFDPTVSNTTREVGTFTLDRMLGFGVVPPTFTKSADDISQADKDQSIQSVRDAADFRGSTLSQDARKKLIAAATQKTLTGTTQSMVEDAVSASQDFDFDDRYDEDADFKFSVQKVAVLDYITGASDRHMNNILVSKDRKQVYAIDNGLNFPRTSEKDFTELDYVHSQPMQLVMDKDKGKIDQKIIEKLKKVDTKKIMAVMKKEGLGNEAVGVVARIKKLVKDSTMPPVTNFAEVVSMEKQARADRLNQATQVHASLDGDPFENLSIIAKESSVESVVDIVVTDGSKTKTLEI